MSENLPATEDSVSQPIAHGRDRRRFARVALDAAVQVAVTDSEKLFDSRIKDLSLSGMFIMSSSTRPIGTGVRIKVWVESEGITFLARGIIVHEVSPDESDDGRPAGVGVMFTEVADVRMLQALIRSGRALDD